MTEQVETQTEIRTDGITGYTPDAAELLALNDLPVLALAS
jgi:hypothetical protein